MKLKQIIWGVCLLCIAGCSSFSSTAENSDHVFAPEWKFKFGSEAEGVVQVPHTWNAIDGFAGPKKGKHNAHSAQSSSYKRGEGVYTQEFQFAPSPSKRYYLYGEGASMVSKAYVNGQKVGSHECPFTAYCYEITPALQSGKNTLRIHVDNTYNDNIVPLGGDFTMFGGLYRTPKIVTKNMTCFVPDYFGSSGVQYRYNHETQTLLFRAIVSLKGTSNNRMTLTMIDPNGKEQIYNVKYQMEPYANTNPHVPESKILPKHPDVVRALNPETKTYICTGEIQILKPKTWNIAPKKEKDTYELRLRLCKDDVVLDEHVVPHYGFRTIEFTHDRGLVVNGKAMTLRGVNRHQDREEKGWAVSAQDEMEDMALISEVGANGLRTAHYPASPNIYDYCDQNGILVWSEVSCIEKVRDRPEFIDNMNTQGIEMVLQHGNHPCIIVWGIFNEIFHQTTKEDRNHDMIKVLTLLNQTLKAVDPTRPTIGNTNNHNKKLSNIADIFGANVYPGWYGGGPDQMSGMIKGFHSKLPQKPFGLGEYGHGADEYCHEIPVKRPNPVSRHHPEEWQSYAHEVNYGQIKKHPEMWGTFIWNMFDFATVERAEGRRPGMNDKGLITYDRKIKKDAFFFYKANWNPEPMIHMNSKRFVERKKPTTEVRGYCNGEKVELYVNQKLIQTQTPSTEKVFNFKEVPLSEGENAVEVRSTIQGKTYTDAMKIIR